MLVSALIGIPLGIALFCLIYASLNWLVSDNRSWRNFVFFWKVFL